MIASTVWTWKIVRRRWQKLLELLIGNILFAIMLFFTPLITNPINNFLFGDPSEILQPGYDYAEFVATIGYHTSVIPLLFFAVFSGLWLTWQFRMLKDVQSGKQKRKREATQPDTSRLTSHDNTYPDHHDYSERTSLARELTS
jgi:hypothetical protein